MKRVWQILVASKDDAGAECLERIGVKVVEASESSVVWIWEVRNVRAENVEQRV